MHELALAEGILAVALDVSEQQRVHRISVRVGALQRVVPDALHFSFELLAQETPAAGAVLTLREVAARVRCQRCGAETAAPDAALACGACGAVEIEVVAGDELLVDAVQLDDGWRFRPATPDEADAPAITVPAEHLAWHAMHDGHDGHGPHPHDGHGTIHEHTSPSATPSR